MLLTDLIELGRVDIALDARLEAREGESFAFALATLRGGEGSSSLVSLHIID